MGRCQSLLPSCSTFTGWVLGYYNTNKAISSNFKKVALIFDSFVLHSFVLHVSACLFVIACPGPEATDDRKIFESHVESGKIFRLRHKHQMVSLWLQNQIKIRSLSSSTWNSGVFHHLSRHPGSTKRLRTARSTLNQSARLKNAMAPPCCLSLLCRRWGMTYSSTSAYQRSSRFLSCSSHRHSSTGSATWGTPYLGILISSI